MNATTRQLMNHPNHNASDLAYLRAKGWTDAEILARWDQERAEGKPACGWSSPTARAKLDATVKSAGNR